MLILFIFCSFRIHYSLSAINGALVDDVEEKAGEQCEEEEEKESIDPDNNHMLLPPPPHHESVSSSFHYVDALSMLILNSARPDDSSTVRTDNSHLFADCIEAVPSDSTVRTEGTARTDGMDPTVHSQPVSQPSPNSVESEIPPPPLWPPRSPTLSAFDAPLSMEIDENVGGVGKIRRINSRRSPRSPSIISLNGGGSPSAFVRPKAINS